MRFKTWPVAALGLGGLLLLVVLSLLAASRRAQEIYTQLDQLNTHHREVDTKLRRLRSDMHLSGIFIRDYLLDPEREHAPDYRIRLAAFRSSNLTTLEGLRTLSGGTADDNARLASLQAKLEDYWQTFDPLFDWTPAEKLTQSARFLRAEVIPRREAVLAITQEIEQLNNGNLTAQRAEVTRRHGMFRSDLHKLLWQSLLLGLVVAVTAVVRLRVLERRSKVQRAIAEDAERQMRKLSQQLVATQEEERKKLSRELHDHVGQMLTALRMELGRIERSRASSDATVVEAVTAGRQLVDDVMRTVRDLALGLRPSMLDDFGLQAALEWHVRDFTRRFGLQVDLTMDGDFDGLPDQHRTCVYRSVQEALTNCVKHSSCRRIQVKVVERSDNLILSVADDGVGVDRSHRGGLGLRGIEERVRELHGETSIRSEPGEGTVVSVRLPIPITSSEVPLARAAG
ncbi:MAG: ATP-binding protein [Vicinamibacterales bacterium]